MTTTAAWLARSTRAALRVLVTVAMVTVGVSLGGATPATAGEDLVPCSPFTAHHTVLGFSFRRCGVPDFDQIRTDLPGDGAMYCVPTSAMNWLAYLAERGVPGLAPGPGFTGPFLSDSQYTSIGNHIQDLGDMMGTDPFDGTGAGGIGGLEQWLEDSGLSSDFGVHWQGAVDLGGALISPTIGMVAATSAQGSLAMLAIGWYEAQGAGQWERDGGHVVSLVGSEPAPDLGVGRSRIVVNDPATALEGWLGDSHQSPFWPDDHITVPVEGYFTEPSGDGEGVKDALIGYSSPAFVDGAVFVTPKFALLDDPASDGLSFTFPPGQPKTVIEGVGVLEDFAIAPVGAEHAAVSDNGDLKLLNGVDGSWRTVATLPGAQRVAYDNRGRLIVLTRDGLVRLLPDHSPDPETRVPVPTDSDELAFDPAAGRLVGWDRETSTLTYLDEALRIVDRQVISPVVDPTDPETGVTLSVNPTDGTVGLLADGTSRLVVVRGGTTQETTLGSGAPLAGLVADSSGVWYSTDQATQNVVAFDREGDPVEGTPFDGLPAGRLFQIWQPMDIGEAHDDRNVLPEDAPRTSPYLEITSATNQVAAGATHQVELLLTDDTAVPADRTLQWKVTGANPGSGTVTTAATGTAAVTWPAIHAGSDHLLVWEDLDGNGTVGAGEPATSRALSTITEHITTTLQVSSAPNPSTVGDDVTISARVVSIGGLTPTGTVTFFDGFDQIGSAPVDFTATATLTTAALPAGVHTISARYFGDALFAPSQSTTTHTVERVRTRLDAHPVLLRLSPLAVTLRLSATLTDASGTPLAGEPVRFAVGGATTCTGITDANGRVVCDRSGLALLKALLALGYDAVYDGNATHAPSVDHGEVVG